MQPQQVTVENLRRVFKVYNSDTSLLLRRFYFSIMAYGSTPYVGMVPKKSDGHIKSAQTTHLKC